MNKELSLQGDIRKYSIQYKITVPVEWVSLLGWDKGDKLKAQLVLGSGKITLEKVKTND